MVKELDTLFCHFIAVNTSSVDPLYPMSIEDQIQTLKSLVDFVVSVAHVPETISDLRVELFPVWIDRLNVVVQACSAGDSSQLQELSQLLRGHLSAIPPKSDFGDVSEVAHKGSDEANSIRRASRASSRPLDSDTPSVVSQDIDGGSNRESPPLEQVSTIVGSKSHSGVAAGQLVSDEPERVPAVLVEENSGASDGVGNAEKTAALEVIDKAASVPSASRTVGHPQSTGQPSSSHSHGRDINDPSTKEFQYRKKLQSWGLWGATVSDYSKDLQQ